MKPQAVMDEPMRMVAIPARIVFVIDQLSNIPRMDTDTKKKTGMLRSVKIAARFK